ncbi:DNA helicase rad5 [Gaertneriomyces sp. JEL0708]|nr:DNA helicase rad5 [Gaertneriomyces sp. JEL0708]
MPEGATVTSMGKDAAASHMAGEEESMLRAVLGDDVSTQQIQWMLQQFGNVERSVDYWFREGCKHASTGKRKRDSEPLPTNQPTQRTANEFPTRVYVGELIMVGYATLSGVRLHEAASIDISCSSGEKNGKENNHVGASKRGRGARGAKTTSASKAGPSGIVRLSYQGREIGRLRSSESWLGALIRTGMVAMQASVVQSPEVLSGMCDIILAVRVFLLSKAFEGEGKGIGALFRRMGVIGDIHDDDADIAGNKQCAIPPDVLDTLYAKDIAVEGELEHPMGMNSTLRGYQLQALKWMVEREAHPSEGNNGVLHPLWVEIKCPPEGAGESRTIWYCPYTDEVTLTFPNALNSTRGGILADEMGLGKTIQMLSLVHVNRPSKDDLLEANGDTPPLSGALGKIMGGAKTGSSPLLPQSPATLIICPLSLMNQWTSELQLHFEENKLRHTTHYGGQRLDVSNLIGKNAPDVVVTTFGVVTSESEKGTGVFGVRWWRVIIDEAHWIRNRGTRGAKAVGKIEAARRWAVTGTPIQNHINDLYSLFLFLRVDPWSNHAFWHNTITLPYISDPTGTLEALHRILSPLLLRRTKSTLGPDGKPIVSLPEKTIEVQYLDFSEAEREVYDAVLKRVRGRFGEVEISAGGRRWGHVFEMLVRLRQCCLHPLLVGAKAKKEGTDGVIDEEVRELVGRYESEGGFAASVIKRLAGEMEEGSGGDVAGGEEDEEKTCPICFDIMQQPTLTPCMHMCCYECIVNYLNVKDTKGEDGDCPICRRAVTLGELLQVVRVPQAQARVASTEKSPTPPLKTRIELHRPLPLSTKLRALHDHIDAIRKTSPDTKTVVFSQFTGMLDLCARYLSMLGVGYVSLDGRNSVTERQASLARFAADDDSVYGRTGDGNGVRVLLASTRAAGVGLNLTRASCVILLEPWWNPAVEQQVIDRVHRIGQTRDVRILRMVVRDSVEERMVEVAKRKWGVYQGLVEGTNEEEGEGRWGEIKEVMFG